MKSHMRASSSSSGRIVQHDWKRHFESFPVFCRAHRHRHLISVLPRSSSRLFSFVHSTPHAALWLRACPLSFSPSRRMFSSSLRRFTLSHAMVIDFLIFMLIIILWMVFFELTELFVGLILRVASL